MKGKACTILFALYLAAAPVSAQEPLLQQQTEGGITFISGGVGYDEREALKKVEGDYNLRLLFAARSGELVADVKVTIQDAKGKTILEAVAGGPRFFAKLAPGAYRITAVQNGTPMTRTVTISSKRPASQAFYWNVVHKDKPVE
ncbi:MAG: carboxypeptidase regulatory-like domain-containing protein [Geobacteraceae bacterium]|nr:carboxypeptidase regulatory-like domain-containing protein [Geobacteraceae bacterium]